MTTRISGSTAVQIQEKRAYTLEMDKKRKWRTKQNNQCLINLSLLKKMTKHEILASLFPIIIYTSFGLKVNKKSQA